MRKKLTVLILSALLLVLNDPAEAQQPKKVPQIGYLALVRSSDLDAAFRKGLDEHGYVDGQNIRVEYRFAEGKVERLVDLAAELVRLNVDVIVASSTQATTPPDEPPTRFRSCSPLHSTQLHPGLFQAWHDRVEISRD